MAREIERKFRVANDDWRGEVTETLRLAQFYLFTRPDASVRVRIRDEASAKLTIKTGSGADRGEFEYDIPLEDAEALRESRIGNLVEKTRHIVPLGAWRVEVDEFEGDLAGLVLAEIELQDIGDQPPLPAFLGREVTGDPRYLNARLALGGLPDAD
ncbi:MAG: CYTH domain-containing protein [Aurantimonas endophytica]|uniref:CYTH domain-containing protein n=1 Tax=Aurantimonas endophytica TaxID=1522175 RepID=A0A7W6MPZ7_9HYPH|nr:CYTH domain-containing protein [Aurantimonas endophytica]MBB4003470.1 CYTH domain-containing protein [Aurantimonas endophytica]MCO6404330.1 CYTH domain-containing protein [Aurantimonas endophytica]